MSMKIIPGKGPPLRFVHFYQLEFRQNPAIQLPKQKWYTRLSRYKQASTGACQISELSSANDVNFSLKRASPAATFWTTDDQGQR